MPIRTLSSPIAHLFGARCGALAVTLVTLAGCGGGGSDAASGEAAAQVTFSGVAATGAALAGASVAVTDSSGAAVCSTATDGAGRYRCTLQAGAKAPFALALTLGDQTLYSVAASASSDTINITPLTTLIAARLAPSGDPARLAEAIKADPAVASAAKVAARVSEVTALLAPLLTAVGDKVDPLHGAFTADGSGHDRVLDSLQITIRPSGGDSAIDITVKAVPSSDGAPPLTLSFKGSDLAPAAIKAAIEAGSLVKNGTALLVAGLAQRFNECYALPLSQRVSNPSGSAGDVLAPVCRGLFIDNDPTTYKDNGFTVGRGAFGGLFSEGSTGVRFERLNIEYPRANGDLLLTYRTVSAKGNLGSGTLTVRPQGGVLKAIGNQYAYDAGVRAYASDREFLFQPQYNWFGSGYVVSIANRIDAAGQPVFKQAEVTSPTGAKVVYKPLAGRSTMGAVQPNGQLRVYSVQFIAAAFQNPATTGSPQERDGAFFVGTQLGDDAIRAIPDQSVWKIEWTHADAALANVVQTYRTVSRAPTLAEVRAARFTQLAPDFKAELLANTAIASNGAYVFGAPLAAIRVGTDAGGDGWSVADGALAPTSITAYGSSVGGVSFNDTASVATSDRKALVACSSQSAADLHCSAASAFAAGTRVTALDGSARSLRQVEFQKQVNLYKATP